jgi:hypothetical protein
METLDFKRIEKEEIQRLRFQRLEMLKDPDAIKLRNERLMRACSLGNAHKGKVTIQFISSEGPHQVTTTIWNFSNDHVGLKNGIHIPIGAITSVSL